MTDLTPTEKRVLAVLTVGGRINRHEFNTLCNLDDIHKDARERALEGLREKQLVPPNALLQSPVTYPPRTYSLHNTDITP